MPYLLIVFSVLVLVSCSDGSEAGKNLKANVVEYDFPALDQVDESLIKESLEGAIKPKFMRNITDVAAEKVGEYLMRSTQGNAHYQALVAVKWASQNQAVSFVDTVWAQEESEQVKDDFLLEQKNEDHLLAEILLGLELAFDASKRETTLYPAMVSLSEILVVGKALQQDLRSSLDQVEAPYVDSVNYVIGQIDLLVAQAKQGMVSIEMTQEKGTLYPGVSPFTLVELVMREESFGENLPFSFIDQKSVFSSVLAQQEKGLEWYKNELQMAQLPEEAQTEMMQKREAALGALKETLEAEDIGGGEKQSALWDYLQRVNIERSNMREKTSASEVEAAVEAEISERNKVLAALETQLKIVFASADPDLALAHYLDQKYDEYFPVLKEKAGQQVDRLTRIWGIRKGQFEAKTEERSLFRSGGEDFVQQLSQRVKSGQLGLADALDRVHVFGVGLQKERNDFYAAVMAERSTFFEAHQKTAKAKNEQHQRDMQKLQQDMKAKVDRGEIEFEVFRKAMWKKELDFRNFGTWEFEEKRDTLYEKVKGQMVSQ